MSKDKFKRGEIRRIFINAPRIRFQDWKCCRQKLKTSTGFCNFCTCSSANLNFLSVTCIWLFNVWISFDDNQTFTYSFNNPPPLHSSGVETYICEVFGVCQNSGMPWTVRHRSPSLIPRSELPAILISIVAELWCDTCCVCIKWPNWQIYNQRDIDKATLWNILHILFFVQTVFAYFLLLNTEHSTL